MANDVGVRSYLQSKGIDNNDIGYDSNSGYVQVKGQNFLKPAANFSGTTYDSQPNLDNAYKMYSQPKIQADPNGYGMNQVGTAGAAVAGGNPGNPVPQKQTIPQYSNPYTQQIAELMKHLSDQSAALSQPVDPYNSPQYAAAQAQQQKNAQLATRAAQESMGQSGFARSTNLADRSQHIQNDANDYITTQVVPQIIATLQAQKQQELQNTQSQFNNVYNLSNQEDSRHQNEVAQANYDKTFDYNAGQDKITNDRNAVNDEATFTGNYSSPEMKALLAKQKANSAAYASATPEEQDRLHQENIAISKQLGQTYDPATGKYSGGKSTRTIAGQELDAKVDEVAYNHARDSLLDKRYEAEFDNNIKQQGFENALKIALQEHQISNDNAQIAISQQNANTSAASQGNSANSAEQTRLMNVWQATGKAPKGIPGVAEGTPIYEKPTADKPKVVDYKTDPNFAADVAHLKSNPADAAKLESNPEPFIKEYGYDGYLALRKAAGKED